MPEGPEIKLSADIIKPLVINKQIINAVVGQNSRYKNNLPEGLSFFMEVIGKDNCFVSNIEVKGKFMYWTFSNGWHLLNTFGMSGQWSSQAGKHPCLGMQLKNNEHIEHIFFNDPRHFGTIKLTNNQSDLTNKLSELGWDPLAENLSDYFPWIRQTLKRSKKQIGEALLDQSIFAGVGNYIRADALYQAKISPFKFANSLSELELKTLCEAVIYVMRESYQHQGATISTYKTPLGDEGRYSTCFKVYGQKQDILGNKVIKQDLGGRTIHWCPSIQQ